MDVIVCCLFYGDYTALAHRLTRCLHPLLLDAESPVKEIRVGLNDVSAASEAIVRGWATTLPIPVQFLQPVAGDRAINVGKYPLMRKLFRLSNAGYLPTADTRIVWFDDDACVTEPGGWWKAWRASQGPQVVGQLYDWFVQPGQRSWYESLPWYDRRIPLELRGNREVIRFVQGSCWSSPLEWLLSLDWPIPELYHTGGDSLLSLRTKHAGGTIGAFNYGTAVNCDEQLRPSRSKRRGLSPPPLGKNYPETPVILPNHEFQLRHDIVRPLAGDGKFIS